MMKASCNVLQNGIVSLNENVKHLLIMFNYTLGCGRKDPMNQGLSVRPSVLPSFCPEVSWGLAPQCFLKLSMVLEAHALCVTVRFFEKKKKNCPKNQENGSKIRFFEFIGKSSHTFFLNLVSKEINPILGIMRYRPKWFQPTRQQDF